MVVEKHVVVICAAVSALALAAAVLGIAGEATTSKWLTTLVMIDEFAAQSFVRYDGVNCVYRRTPAFGCGIAAAASLLTGQAILTAASGCWDRCRTRSNHRRVGAVFTSVLSWFLAILSTCAFVVGAFRNESGERRPKEDVTTYYKCTVLVAGVFAGASFFALVAAAIGITSYIALEATATSAPPWPEELRQGAVMRQPQLQPHDGCPVACPTCGTVDQPRPVAMKELFEGESDENFVLHS